LLEQAFVLFKKEMEHIFLTPSKSYRHPEWRAVFRWLPVFLFMITAALIRLHMNFSTSYLLIGSDGPYNPIQVRNMVDHFSLGLPDMPLLFSLEAIFAKLLQLLHAGSPDQCIIYAVQLTDAFVPPLAAIPVFLISREVNKPGSKTGLFDYLMAGFSVLNMSTMVIFANSGLQKNAVAVILIFFYIYFVLRLLKYHNRKDVYYLLLMLLLGALTHYGSFSIMLLLSGLTVIFWIYCYKVKILSLNYKKMLLALFIISLLFAIIAFFDVHRAMRLLQIPFRIFEAPVLLFKLNGQDIVLNGFILFNLVLLNLLSLGSLVVIIANRKKWSPPVNIMGLALVVLTLFLEFPLLGLEWANRLFMMGYIPITVLSLIFFNNVRSIWVKALPALIFILLMIYASGYSIMTPRFVSISNQAFQEFKQIKNKVPFDDHTVLIARQDLRLLGNWVFKVPGVADYLFTKSDFSKYDNTYLIYQTKGNNLPSPRYRQVSIPSNSPEIFKGAYFEIYKLKDTVNWQFGNGNPVRAAGEIISIDGNYIELDNRPSASRRVRISGTTEIYYINSGNKLRPGMYVQVYGRWRPFSLTVDAQTIRETIRPK